MAGNISIDHPRVLTQIHVNSRGCTGRRNPTNWTYTSVPTPTNTRHGFTGHEHLDKFALINMNGRVYDPVIGRFLSPDPYIQLPYFAQNFDRYSYVWNNPLKYVDPSGDKVGGNGPGFAHWWYIQMLKIKRATYEIWDDPFDDPLSSGGDFYDYGTSGGGGGGGAPAGGSAASGPGSGGGGGGGGPLVKAKKESFGNRYKLRRVPRGKTSDIAYFRNSGGIVKDSYLNNLEEKAGKYDWASRLYQKISNDLLIELAVSGNADLTASESDSRSFKTPEYGRSVSFTPGDDYPGTNMSVSNNGNNLLSVDGYNQPPSFSGKSKAGDVMDVNLMRRQPAFNDFYAQPPTDLSFPGGGTTLITINVIPSFQFQLQCGLEY
ncbi:MAG: RHS repeat-associated core domain-containing protein [Bacteroidales bacterium]